jgi:hypothetical protein
MSPSECAEKMASTVICSDVSATVGRGGEWVVCRGRAALMVGVARELLYRRPFDLWLVDPFLFLDGDGSGIRGL